MSGIFIKKILRKVPNVAKQKSYRKRNLTTHSVHGSTLNDDYKIMVI